MVCVGLGILEWSDYPRTDGSGVVCVGLGILEWGGYPHTDGSGVVCVGSGILEWVDYSHTDAASPRIPFMPHDSAFDYLPYQKIR